MYDCVSVWCGQASEWNKIEHRHCFSDENLTILFCYTSQYLTNHTKIQYKVLHKVVSRACKVNERLTSANDSTDNKLNICFGISWCILFVLLSKVIGKEQSEGKYDISILIQYGLKCSKLKWSEKVIGLDKKGRKLV